MNESGPIGRPSEPIRAPRGTAISCKGWPQEAALRMLMNNLDPDVAERWEDLVVYGGAGKAARNWDAFHRIVASLRGVLWLMGTRIVDNPTRRADVVAEHVAIVDALERKDTQAAADAITYHVRATAQVALARDGTPPADQVPQLEQARLSP